MAGQFKNTLPAIVLGPNNLQLWNTVVQELIDDDVNIFCVPNTHNCLDPVAFQILYSGDKCDQQLVVFDLGIAEELAQIIQEDPDRLDSVVWGRCGACAQIFADVPQNPWLEYGNFI